MDALTLPRTVLRAEYALIRKPIQLAQDRLLTLFPADDARRLTVERVLGQVDSYAGRFLADTDLTGRGNDLQAHADATAKAKALQAKAREQREQADATLKATQEKSTSERKDAIAEHTEDVNTARADATQAKADAARQSAAKATAQKQAVAEQAAQRVEFATDKQRAEHEKTRQHADAVTAAPKGQLAEARDTKADAAGRRADADRLAGLAETEKQHRRSQN